MKIIIITPWLTTSQGNEPLFQSILIKNQHSWTGARDITGQPARNIPSAPNLAVWEIQDISQEAINTLEADGRCFVIRAAVLDALASAQAVQDLRFYLENAKLSKSQVEAIAGDAANNKRTYRQVAQGMATWAKQLPRARD